MKVLQINITYKIGSTGRIVDGIGKVVEKHGDEAFAAVAYSCDELNKKVYPFYSKKKADRASLKNIAISRITGKMGYRGKRKTEKLVQWIERIKPDIIHLHNFHGDWLHVETLFRYLKSKNIPVVWTLHDCWPFTGRCSHFVLCGCEKWKSGCYGCKNKMVYPYTYFFDFSKQMYADKKNWFCGLKNTRIVTPSAWLSGYVNESFLNQYDVGVLHNGIDTTHFYRKIVRVFPNIDMSKRIILGVANTWTKNKGIYDFIHLNELISHEQYQIVLVGVNNRTKKMLPSDIVTIAHTNSTDELAELYSLAMCYVNMTYLDNYPTTNMEAQCCGTPVITYLTGGSPENVIPGYGAVLEQGDIDGIMYEIQRAESLAEDDRYRLSARATDTFAQEKCFENYYAIYQEILKLGGGIK